MSDQQYCSVCGSTLVIVDDAPQDIVELCEGFPALLAAMEQLNTTYEPGTIGIGLCEQCSTTVLIGPTVSVEGVVVDKE